jgi:hypothetical protein
MWQREGLDNGLDCGHASQAAAISFPDDLGADGHYRSAHLEEIRTADPANKLKCEQNQKREA